MIKLIGAKLKLGNDLCYISFYFGCFINVVFQIDWLGNGRKETFGSGR